MTRATMEMGCSSWGERYSRREEGGGGTCTHVSMAVVACNDSEEGVTHLLLALVI